MHAGNQPVVFGRIMIGNKPVEMSLDDLTLQTDKKFFRRQTGESEQFADPRDADAADSPCRYCKNLSLALGRAKRSHHASAV